MLHLLIESGHFIEERKKIADLDSRLFLSAVDMIESAYWLIGGNQFAQALVLLDGAIELVLKGELERIHPLLIADTRNMDFENIKALLKEEFERHPSGKSLGIREFDLEKSITYAEAFDRFSELHPSIKERRRRLVPSKNGGKNDGNIALHARRNDIVHGGGDAHEGPEYVAAIVEVALPLLEELLGLISHGTQSAISLPRLLKEWIYREVGVAQAVLQERRENGLGPAVYAIAPLAHHIVWSHTRWPSPQDDRQFVDHGGWEWFEFAARQRLPQNWNPDLVMDIDCPICGSTTPDHSYVPSRVLFDDDCVERRKLIPVAFVCYVCGFDIDQSEKYLAKHFIPPISAEKEAAFHAEFGIG